MIQRENYSKRRYDKLIESIIKLENAIENTRRDKEILIKELCLIALYQDLKI